MEDGLIYEHDLHDVLEIQQALLTFVKEHEEMIKSHYTLSEDYHFEDNFRYQAISGTNRNATKTLLHLYESYKSFNGRSLNSKVCNNDWINKIACQLSTAV